MKSSENGSWARGREMGKNLFHSVFSFHFPDSSIRRFKTFTLIELLIVIAIIAILLHSKSGFFMANYGRSAF